MGLYFWIQLYFQLNFDCQDVESGFAGVKGGDEQGGGGELRARSEAAAESLAVLQREVLANKAVVLALQPIKQVRVKKTYNKGTGLKKIV